MQNIDKLLGYGALSFFVLKSLSGNASKTEKSSNSKKQRKWWVPELFVVETLLTPPALLALGHALGLSQTVRQAWRHLVKVRFTGIHVQPH